MKVCSSLPSLQSTWLLKSGCFEGAQGSAMLSWVPSPSESIPHSPPSHSPSRGCTSLWCFAGNWPEIWGRILTWVLIIRWVIVSILLSVYTRDASGLLWDGEIHLAKKKKNHFHSFIHGRLPLQWKMLSCILFNIFLSRNHSTVLPLAQHVPPWRITLPKSMQELGFATRQLLSLFWVAHFFSWAWGKKSFSSRGWLCIMQDSMAQCKMPRALGQRKTCFLLLGICFKIETLIPMSASKC